MENPDDLERKIDAIASESITKKLDEHAETMVEKIAEKVTEKITEQIKMSLGREEKPLANNVNRCAKHGCMRPPFENRKGQTCCKTCWKSYGRCHGPECEARHCQLNRNPV